MAHTHRLGYFLETFVLIEDSDYFPLSFDAGLTFLAYPRIQFYIYAGNRGINGDRFWFGGAGIGFRIDPGDLESKDFIDSSADMFRIPRDIQSMQSE